MLSGSSALPPAAVVEPPPATVLQTPGSNARSSREWRPSKLLCKRFNVPDPFFGRAETSQTAQSSSNRLSKTFDTAALLGISGSHSASAVVDMAALERLAAALKQTADEDKSKQALSLSQAQADASKAAPGDKMPILADTSSADNAEPLPRAPDDLFASIFGVDEGISEDVELPPAVTAAATASTVAPAVVPISNDELANMYSAMSKAGGPTTSSMARSRKFSSSWDEAPPSSGGSLPPSSAGGFRASSARSELLAAPAPKHGSASDAVSSASHFLKTISSDAYDGFLPSMDELQRDNGASFKQLKSRDSVIQPEQLPSWRSKLVAANDQATDASKSIKDKVDIKMQALAAAREALVSSSNTPAPSQRPETNVADVMHGPSLPPPGSAWAGPSWQPKPVSWGSAPAVRGSQSFVAATSAVAQPMVQPGDGCAHPHASTGSPHREAHSHTSKHKHRDSKKDHEAERHRHRSDSDKKFKDEVKEGHKHRHHRSDDGGDRRHHRR